MVFSNNLLLGAADAGGGYEIENSVRLDGVGDMSRTIGSDGDLREWSWSFWVKRSGLGTNGGLGFNIGGTYADASNRSIVRFYSSSNGTDDFYWAERSGGAWREDQWTIAQYRDPSAWYHILLVWDTDGGTTPRARRYINGVQITDLGGSPAAAANADSGTNKAGTFQLFDQAGFPGREFEGYCAEMHFVDGTALAPTDFGEFNADGVWIPKQVTGITYGSNGFYLDFADSSDLGKDVSGNNNDFTSSGLATTDQMLDTPTNNYSIFNPVASCNVSGQPLTISDGNLRTSAGGTLNAIEAITQIGPSSGKWYAEFTLNAAPQLVNQYPIIGVIAADLNITSGNNIGNSTFRGYIPNGTISGGASYGNTFTTNDIIGCAIDLDNQKIWWSKNGVFQNSGDPAAGTNAAFTNLTAGLFYRFCISHAGSTATDVTGNFGQTGGFTYTPPTGFNALSTANLDDPTIADPSAHMQTLAYASTGTITAFVQDGNSQFEPGLVWEKSRTGANNHLWFDQVRGATKFIRSDTTNAENTVADTLTSFNSNGFTAGADSVNWGINYPGRNNVAWMWKANGAGSSNTDGSITSTVSADTTSGFSIIRWSGTGANGTIGHGLGIQPSLYIVKNTATTNSWMVGSTLYSNTQFLILNATDALDTAAAVWNSAYPTSSVVNLGSNAASNGSGTNNMICYAFAEVEGFSSIGSYTGNGSATDGPFVYTGFAPEFIMVKSSSNSGTSWDILDATRETFNTRGNQLYANSSATEASNDHECDFLSNGFKWRDGSASNNGSGYTIIYMAFAKHPFGGDGVAPATAR
jgi:hypothetical protein